MRQVFANLLDNALKYAPEGGAVKLACAVENGRVVVRITDNGMGISPANSRAFGDGCTAGTRAGRNVDSGWD